MPLGLRLPYNKGMSARHSFAFSGSKLLLGNKPFANADDMTRARLLVNIVFLTIPVALFNALVIFAIKGIPLFVSIAAVPACVLMLLAVRLRLRPRLLGVLYGVLMELLFIEAAVREVSLVTYIGLILVPLAVTLFSGRKPAVFFVAATIVFVYLPRFVINPSFVVPVLPSDLVAYCALLFFVYFVGCGIEKLALDLYSSYLDEKKATLREMEARKAKERLLETVFSSIPVPFFVKDEFNRYTACSDSFFEYVGVRPETVIGKKPIEVYPPDIAAAFDAADKRIFETGLSLGYSTSFVHPKDKSPRHVTILRTPLKNDAGFVVGSVGVLLDETDRLEKERGLESLLESNRGAIALLSHDLRNPLGSFRDLVRSMEADEEIDPREFREVLSEMGKSLDSLYRLLDELLDWAKVSGGMDRFEPTTIPLNASVDKILSLVSTQAGAKGIRLESRVPPDSSLFADVSMLEAILRNLVGNAVKFTPRGGDVIVSASADASGRGVTLSVADTGIGMPYASIRSLFDSGKIRHKPGTDGEPGSGLGLPLCKRLIERHGGVLDIESVEGSGSLFSVFFPHSAKG